MLHIIQCLLGSLQRARTALVLPKKKAIDELMKSRNMVSISLGRNEKINNNIINII